MFEIGGKQIANSLSELIAPGRAALLLWDMEYGIAPNAFNYQQLLPNLQIGRSKGSERWWRLSV